MPPPPSSVTLTFHNPDIPPSHSPPILPLRRSPSLLSCERLFLLKGTRQTGQTLSSSRSSVFQLGATADLVPHHGSPFSCTAAQDSRVFDWCPAVVPLWLTTVSLTRC